MLFFLVGWFKLEKILLKFAILRIWRELRDHTLNCYFRIVDLSKRRAVKHESSFKLAIALASHSAKFSVLYLPERAHLSSESNNAYNKNLIEDIDHKIIEKFMLSKLKRHERTCQRSWINNVSLMLRFCFEA